MTRLARLALLVVVNVGLVVLLLALVEGATSLLLFVRDAARTRPLAERRHTVPDTLLGWANEPGVSRADLYGPGAHLTINAQGFRGTDDVALQPAPGQVRVICSGDSFTLGYGVADDQTWCHQLGELDPRLDPINMGQGGYGFDQAWLWYWRDGVGLDADVHVLAFITDDFRRMRRAEFLGYAKPLLAVAGDSIVVENIPVPQTTTGVRGWFTRNRESIAALRSVQFARRLAGRLGDGDAVDPAADSVAHARVVAVVERIVADLARHHAARGSRLVLVLLPTSYELVDLPADAAEWTARLDSLAARHGVLYLDLFPLVRGMAPAEQRALYLQPGEVDYPAAAGHYTPEGNALVAREIHATLERLGWLAEAR